MQKKALGCPSPKVYLIPLSPASTIYIWPKIPVKASNTRSRQPDSVTKKANCKDLRKSTFLKEAQKTTSLTASSRPENK